MVVYQPVSEEETDLFFAEHNLGTPTIRQRKLLKWGLSALEEFLPETLSFFTLEKKLSLKLSQKLNKVAGALGLDIPASYEPALKNIIGNFLYFDFEEMLVSFDSNFYDAGSRYNLTKVGFRIHMNLWEALKSNGYVEISKTEQSFEEEGRKRSSVKPTELFISKIKAKIAGLTEAESKVLDKKTVVLRKRVKGDPVGDDTSRRKRYIRFEFKDDTLSRKRAKFLDGYNRFISQQNVSISLPENYLLKRQEQEILESGRLGTNLHCVFTAFSDNHAETEPLSRLGGRFYGGYWQGLKGSTRTHISINGNPTAEMDYIGQHLNMLYSLELGKPYGDPYEIDLGLDYEKKVLRKAIKRAVPIALNTSSRSEFLGAFRNKVSKEEELTGLSEYAKSRGVDLAVRVIEAILRTHIPLKKYFFKRQYNHSFLMNGVPSGLSLQFIDSELAVRIMQYFLNKNILVLPVHDSFIIESKYAGELEEVMNREFISLFKLDKTTQHNLVKSK